MNNDEFVQLVNSLQETADQYGRMAAELRCYVAALLDIPDEITTTAMRFVDGKWVPDPGGAA